ncbi:MAG: type II toxin-antitoxin system prevent-host-death family antitoxin [Solirubrobacterales bacterium]|nr:type II toxin-antitoxin system prevent-host-death family antitoxin [Solirubrobacterales bacterium]
MAKAVPIGEAKTNFSKLIRRAEAGEEIIVRRGSEPVARIVPLEKKSGGVTGRGSMKGEIWIVSDEEMKKVDREIEQMFEESEIFPGENSQPDQG